MQNIPCLSLLFLRLRRELPEEPEGLWLPPVLQRTQGIYQAPLREPAELHLHHQRTLWRRFSLVRTPLKDWGCGTVGEVRDQLRASPLWSQSSSDGIQALNGI